MNRQNNVLYAPAGKGAPEQWYTEARQSHDNTVYSHAYKWLLAHKVLPLIKRKLGLEKFNKAIWQQNGAKPHIVIDWLDGIFGSRMLALNNQVKENV